MEVPQGTVFLMICMPRWYDVDILPGQYCWGVVEEG
jgi:hypothetical protein